MTYRTRLRIISELLSAVHYSGTEGGASASTLMRRCNLSYRGLEQLAAELVNAGLLQTFQGEGVRYVLSDKGSAYLRQYQQFQAFAESYGLKF